MQMLDESLQVWLHDQLFEQVPCNIAVIDRDYNIVDHNAKFQELFGPGRGKLCHSVYKKRSKPCSQCIASKTFADGKYRVNDEVGVDRNGRTAHYLVHVAPIFDENGDIPYIIEMSTDITEIKRLQSEYQVLFEKVPCYITIVNRDYRIVSANELMRNTFGATSGQHCWEVFKHRDEKCEDCPVEQSFKDGQTHTCEQVGFNKDGEKTHYVVTSSALDKSDTVNHVIEMAVDVTRIHQLEQEKIEAERLAAVGQTVTGLAHSIKNILAGLEGGIYIFKTGLDRDERARIDQGWGMVNRNIDRISSLTKNLLNFSKGTHPKVEMIDTVQLTQEVVDLFKDSAMEQGIQIIPELDPDMQQAAFDRESLHTCLANLVTNAIDACQMSEKPGCTVTVRCQERDGSLVFEVEDKGCGMDYEVKQKVFTNFFSTKGKGGTGVGLLLTRKITQEHGGKVSFESIPGEGSVFRLKFPRERLPLPEAAEELQAAGQA